jgi:Lipid desaturase domain
MARKLRSTSFSPLYLECTRAQAFQVWLGVVLHLSLVAWCLVWLIAHRDLFATTWPWCLAMLPVSLFFADWLSALIHWATDTWFDEISSERTVSIAREHHIYPAHIVGYGMRDYLGYSCWPAFLVIGPPMVLLTTVVPTGPVVFVTVTVLTQISLIMIFGTYAHRLGHVATKSRVVRLLQRCRLLISPNYHVVHHREPHLIRYGVINGWSNEICDRIGFWRDLEKLISFVTGAIPRRSDDEWTERFQVDPAFMQDPLPSLLRLRVKGAIGES